MDKPNEKDVLLACAHLMQIVDQKAKHLEATNTVLLAACKGLIEYRDRVGSLNFQLEKADDYIRMMRNAIDALDSAVKAK